MEILINGKPADIKFDTEKTLGEVISGIELWISATGNRIRKICLDGSDIAGEGLDAAFDRDIKDIRKLEFTLSFFSELAIEALLELDDTCGLYAGASLEERRVIADAWEKSAAARFLASDISDICKLASDCFAGSGLSVRELKTLLEERLSELSDPLLVISGAETLVKNICLRMEELPLDMQTGKDQRAAETIQLFSGIGEKLFRILFIFKSEGLSMDTFLIEELPVRSFMDEFNRTLDEISDAYKNRDTVLAGDIAEYELAPRLLKFYEALRNIKISDFRV